MSDGAPMRDVPTLSTARFTMRPLRRGDAEALFPTLSDPEQCLYLSHPPFTSPAQLWEWLAEEDWPGRSWIAQDADGEVVGRFVAVDTHAPDVFEIGYIVCSRHQGQGIAGECSRTLNAHLFETGTRKLTAEVDPRNAASVRLLESLGFKREGYFREHEITHIGMCDVAWYGKLRKD